jgi:hypothetical protein
VDMRRLWEQFCYEKPNVTSESDGDRYIWSWQWARDHKFAGFAGKGWGYDYELFKAAVEAGDPKALEILPEFVSYRLEQGG